MLRVLALVLFALPLVSGCGSNSDRQSGVCYCEFASGDESEYDLTDTTRSEQVAECRRHDENAQAFGGRCELE